MSPLTEKQENEHYIQFWSVAGYAKHRQVDSCFLSLSYCGLEPLLLWPS
jgi:hypothetical protein